MRNARHVIAVTLMATAICADRSLAAAPAEPQVSHLAGRIIQKLSIRLRRVVRAVCIYRPRRVGLACARASAGRFNVIPADFVSPQLSPFQFRLPPPSA